MINSMTNKRFLAFKLFLLSSAFFSVVPTQARESYACNSDITHFNCTMFCESEAESIAKSCALTQCEQDDAIHGGNADCEITYSRSSSYVRSYDAVRHFLGYAIARPRR